jgi:hypothetical protein
MKNAVFWDVAPCRNAGFHNIYTAPQPRRRHSASYILSEVVEQINGANQVSVRMWSYVFLANKESILPHSRNCKKTM